MRQPVARKMTVLMRKRSDREDSVRHLHIVLNDPCDDLVSGLSDRVVIANCTSVKPDVEYDDTCVLDAGCHSFIKQESCITYRRVMQESAYFLENAINSGEFDVYESVSEELYCKIMDGLLKSKAVAVKHKRFLRAAAANGFCGNYRPNAAA